MGRYKTIDKMNFKGKKVLLRCDLNVPILNGKVSDNSRLIRSLKTIKTLSSQGARTIIMSHLGRPKGESIHHLSLKPIASSLRNYLNQDIYFCPSCLGPETENAIARMNDGEIVLLENLRFYPEEQANDKLFAKSLAGLADYFVNDAFSCSHRAHASISGITSYLESFAGPLLQEELSALSQVLEKPKHPLAAIIGGAKISTKMRVLHNIISIAEHIIIGGGMANTFLAAQGYKIGTSIFEENMINDAKLIISKANQRGCEIVLPIDCVTASHLKANVSSNTWPIDCIPDNEMILDLGPLSLKKVFSVLRACHTIVWNGPIGAFEIEPFGEGTSAIANEVSFLTETRGIISVAGGGDTLAALNNARIIDRLSYTSTAGGAFLEWLEGRKLPGIEALSDFKN